jgi:hypothetical protein
VIPTARTPPRRFAVGLLLAIASCHLLPACEDERTSCPAIALPAIDVLVVDASGSVVPSARVTALRDGSVVAYVSCSQRAASGDCLSWRVLQGPGTYVVSASRADGSSPTQQTVVVPAGPPGDCRELITQSVTIELPAAATN